MNIELKKRFLTSIFLIALLVAMYIYSFVLIISLIIIGIITWVEFYALISKIIISNTLKSKFLRFSLKASSLFYLSLLIFFIILIESYYINLKIYLVYTLLVAIFSDIGGIAFGKFFKGKKLTKISPNKTISGSIGSFVLPFLLIPFFDYELIRYESLTLFMITIFISLFSESVEFIISIPK